MKRVALKHQYGDLFSSVSELLFESDPIGINFETNTDEYEPEVRAILPRLTSARSVTDVHDIVYEEFVRLFDEAIAGPKDAYVSISARIWELWSNFQAGE